MRIRYALLAVAVLMAAIGAVAQPPDSGDSSQARLDSGRLEQDPPSRVARLNWLRGNVSFQPAGVDNWTDATLNYPLTTGDHLYTDAGARAELHVGPNALRLDSQSNFSFLNLDDRTVQARFTEGALEISLRRLEDDEIYEVDTPQAAVSLLRTGDYRVDADSSRNAVMVTVWSGEAELSTGGRTFLVHARQTAYLADGFDADIRSANSPDDFDVFTRDRNIQEDRLPPPVHVSQSMAGYEDLESYGAWEESPDYGWAWSPRVAAEWAPYHDGRWAWVEPWGWTWVDQAPWGFAPFHYGRWAYASNRWLWVPGAVVARPVYAPALVAFVGGPRFTLTLGAADGGVAWFPLGPREPFYPAYRVSNAYVRQVNTMQGTNSNVNPVNVTNVRYVNQQVPGAVMAMPRQAFVNSRPVRERGQLVPAQQIAQAQVLGGGPGVAPRRESLVGMQTNRTVATPSPAVMSRPVVARSAPPPPAVSFEAREQLIQQNQGRPLPPEQVLQLRRQPGAVVNRPAIRTFDPRPARTPDRGGMERRREPAPESVTRPEARPVDKFEERPPAARPAPAAPSPAPVVPTAPFYRPEMERRAPAAPRPQPEIRPQPEFRPQPDVRRQPETRPQPEVRREPAPAVREPRSQPAPERSQRREERKSDK